MRLLVRSQLLERKTFFVSIASQKPLSNSAFRATLQDCSSRFSLTLIGSCHSFWYQVTLQRHCWHMKMIVFLFWFCNCGNGPNTKRSSTLNVAILQLGTQHSHMTKRQRGPTLCYCSSPSSQCFGFASLEGAMTSNDIKFLEIGFNTCQWAAKIDR